MPTCPNCRRDSPPEAVRCAGCGAPLPGTRLTPAVLAQTRPVTEADVETRMAPPGTQPYAAGGTAVLVPGQTFGNRYQVISLLGAGGMGAVYHVWDVELNMSLALKVIRPEADPAATQELERRFKRELVLARQVTHANVIRIHDLGEIDGIKYITMPFVHGTDLAHLLAREGRLAVPRTLSLVRQIASGLRAAHDVGIVHRDLKPANILLDEADHAQITDFGIARSTAAGTIATAAGAIMGTLAYMAPEQATGQPVDQRADIYALGLICYEMLSGRPPTGGLDSALAVLMQRARQAPPRLRTIDPSIPEPLDRIVARCLEPDPGARYQTTADLLAELERLDTTGHEKLPAAAGPRRWPVVAAGVGLAILALTAWAWVRSSGSPTPDVPLDPVSAIVADFENLASDPVFEGSLEQAFSIAIEGASFITTYPRATALSAMAQIKPGAPLDVAGARMIAAREDIKIVFGGSIAADGPGRYRLTVKALDRDGRELHEAAERLSGKGAVLGGVEHVANRLRDDLGDTTPENARQPAFETVTAGSLEALQAYAKAQDLSTSGRAEEAIRYYEEALGHDPEFGRAYSGWATALFNIGRRDEAAAKWAEATRRMERMTERERLRTLGGYYLGPGADYDLGIRTTQELVTKYPADRAGHINLAIAYFQTLQFGKALEEARQAAEIFPQNSRARSNLSLIAMYASEFETARAEAARAVPAQYKAYLPMAAAAFEASDAGAMREAYEQMRKTGGAAAASLAAHGLADLLLYEGRWAQAIAALPQAIAADDAAKNTGAGAAKRIMLAEAYLWSGALANAAATAAEAVSLMREDATLLPAALVLLHAGRAAEAGKLAAELGGKVQPRSRAYSAIIEGEIERKAGRAPEARDHFAQASRLADIWLARLAAGSLQVDLGNFPQADGELRICHNRRGEAMALFFDDAPTFRYLAPLSYWTARAQDGLGGGSARLAGPGYRKFLSLRPESPQDALVIDAGRRLAALTVPSPQAR